MSAWWWLLVTETCSILYVIEYILVCWLNDILVSNTKQRDGFYQNNYERFLYLKEFNKLQIKIFYEQLILSCRKEQKSIFVMSHFSIENASWLVQRNSIKFSKYWYLWHAICPLSPVWLHSQIIFCFSFFVWLFDELFIPKVTMTVTDDLGYQLGN
jgi:hypothetical protein